MTHAKPSEFRLISLRVSEDGALEQFPPDISVSGACAAIGSFDGVHLGHAEVIKRNVARAKSLDAPSMVICFDPHPQSLLNPDAAPFRLMTLRQQARAFAALKVDFAVALIFDRAMASLTAEDFVEKIIHGHLGLKSIECGFDFTFGRFGKGKAETLQSLCATHNIACDIVPCQSDSGGLKLSSSAVREALIEGDINHATAILGHPQAYEGVVIKGDQKGRTIGFPTLNMELGAYQRPKYGVYVSRTMLADGRILPSITNFGKRPTVDGLSERLETHLFDIDEDLYGQTVEVALLAHLRPEQKFASFPDLKAQIERDAATARAFHNI